MTLAHARVGERVTVERVGGERAFRRRLMELGLVPGTQVEMIGVAPLGDPLEFLVRGCSLSIRRGEALWVSVQRAASGAGCCCGTTAVAAEVATPDPEPAPTCGSCGTR